MLFGRLFRVIILINHKRSLTPEIMPPTGDEHAKLIIIIIFIVIIIVIVIVKRCSGWNPMACRHAGWNPMACHQAGAAMEIS